MMAQGPSEQARFEILLEEVRADQRILAEGHSLLDAKIDRLIQQMNEQFAMANQQLVAVTQRMTQRLSGVETAVLELSHRTGSLETAVQGFDHRLIVHEQLHQN